MFVEQLTFGQKEESAQQQPRKKGEGRVRRLISIGYALSITLSTCPKLEHMLSKTVKKEAAHPFSASSRSLVLTITISASTSLFGLEKLSIEKA